MTDHVPPQLCNLLKTYQCTATKSLQGPGLSMVHSHKKEILSPSELIDDPPLCPPPQPPQLSQPILTAPDTQRSILYETILEGKPIACFLIGGEMRLCVPQILNTILTVYKLDQIYKCCDELQISFSECTDEQLSEFKAAKILPENIKGSGLITRTNAERLCSALLHRPDVRRIIKGSGSFRVYHKCFGRCEGVCTPDLYSYKEQACIECLVCHGMFSPQRFVCHAHANRETQVCHWGFDSNNWRAYLHVSLDEDSMDKYTNLLDELSERESQKVTNYFVGPREGCNLKKKAPIDEPHIQITCKTEPIDIPAKKSKRVDDATSYLIDYHHQYQALMYAQYRQQQISAFRPWAQTAATITQQAAAAASGGQSLKHLTHIPYAGIPYLSQEPPVLQHPERVVPLSDCERFERSYQPNVALAPRKPNHISVKERDKDRGTNTINNTNNTINNNNSNTNNNTNRVIQMTDIQIKQERPSTPTPPATLQPSISITALHQTASNVINSPIELRISASPNTKPNTTNGPDHLLTNGSTSIVPQPSFSPETLSGSNEITSSTSPVLINIKTDVDCARSPVPIELHQTKIELRSPTIHHHHHHNHQHHNSIILKNVNNGNNNIRANTISGNSEFELSTDTDDDSLNGEPDSSNTNLPLEIASDIMKNCRPDEREKIIHLIRCLLQENSQLRHFVIDNQNELRRRDEQINELLQQQHDLEEQIRRSAAASLMVQQISSPNIETTTGSVIQTKMENIGTISQMDQTATTITRCLSPRKPIRLNHHQTEVIMKPLKKLLRRSPIDEMNASSAGVVVIKKNELCNNNRIGVVMSGGETTKLSISSQSPLLSSTGGGNNNNNGSSTALSSTSSTTSSLSSPTASESNINLNNSNTSITRICSNNINNINNNNNNSSVSKTDDCNSNNNNSCSNKNNLKDNDHDHNDCDRNNTSPDSG